MEEFNNMTTAQQIEFLAWEIEEKEHGISYLQDLLEAERKKQEWRIKKLNELNVARDVERHEMGGEIDPGFERVNRLKLVTSISEGASQ